ncbi:MAG: hypothetical protein ACK4FB_13090 [Brevundimonas sp.]|uniref:hypothetical protein n=1 Tax=Brevundimonas sp. TaxID=1871086 RepID=UPI00391CFC83
MPLDELPSRSARSTEMSPRAIAALRKSIAVIRREMDAGERTWTAGSLAGDTGAAHVLDPYCNEEMRAKAIAFFGASAGSAIQIERNIRAGQLRVFDPINGKILASTKSLIFRKYQLFFFSFKDEPIILGCLGSKPMTLMYPSRRVMIDIVKNKEDPYNFVNAAVRLVRSCGLDFYRHLSVNRPSKTACVVGDERPTHYLLESLGALQKLEETDRLARFWKTLDYLIVPTDYAFIPADELFNVPSSVQVAYVPLADVNRLAIDRNLFVQRFMRSGHNMSESLRKRVVDYADRTSRALEWPDTRKALRHADHITVWFSVEIEKGRIQNQAEVFHELLSVLTARFDDRFRLIVDGWSPMPLSAAPKDKFIAGKVREFMREQMALAPQPVEVIEAFTLPYRDKLKLCGEADFFVSMQGAAALVPSGLRHKPGVTYHNTWGLSSELEVWTENLRRVTPRKEVRLDARSGGRDPFEVDISLFRTTVEALIDEEKIGRPSV